MLFFKTKPANELAKLIEEESSRMKENQRRREYCVDQASRAYPEQAGDMLRLASEIYEWIYGEKP